MTAPTGTPSGTPAPAIPAGVDPDRTARSQQPRQNVNAPTPGLHQGVVTAVDVAAGEVTLTLGGSDVPIPNVRTLSNYRAKVNDSCWVLTNGSDMLALDRTTNAGPSVISDAGAQLIVSSETYPNTGSWGNLATPGPQVTTTVSPSGRLLVGISAWISADTVSGAGGAMAPYIYGAAGTLVNPSLDQALIFYGAAAGVVSAATRVLLYVTIPPGEYHVTCSYTGLYGTARFQYRQLWVLPL